jgi:outer membrane lipoprotein-sorting protein
MKKLSVLIITLFVAASSFYAQTLEEVLQKYYKAVNQEKLNTVQTVTVSGKVLQGGMEIPMTIMQKRPTKFRTEATFQGMNILSGYDGEIGWMINPFMGQTEAQPMTEEQLEQTKDQADIDGYLYNYEKKGFTLELLPQEDMDGTKVYPIKVTKKNGDVVNNYLDAENYIVLKTKAKVKMMGVETEAETYFSNYKPVDEMIFPFNIETKAGGQTAVQIVFDSVEFNKEVADSLFVMPVKK